MSGLVSQSAGATLRIAVSATLLASCTSDLPVQPGPAEPEFEILDAVHNSGNPHFFFLPPIVSKPPRSTGAFDATVNPVVQICQWTGTACGVVIAEFTRESGRKSERVLVEGKQAYVVTWDTKRFALEVNRTYRIRVLLTGIELGHADVELVRKGLKLKHVHADESIPLVDGRKLPVKFRIERDALSEVVGTIPPGGGTISLGGVGSVTFPAESFSTPQVVSLGTRAPSEEAAENFTQSAALFHAASRVPWEVHVNTGLVAPAAVVTAAIRVPDEVLSAAPSGYGFGAFVRYTQIGLDLLDNFELVASTFEPGAKSVSFELAASAFTDLRRADRTFEAVAVLAAVPAAGSPAGLSSPPTLSSFKAAGSLGLPPQWCGTGAKGPPLLGSLMLSPNGGFNPDAPHMGGDYLAADGVVVIAMASGTIDIIDWQYNKEEEKGWGQYIVVRGEDGWAILYGHLKQEPGPLSTERGKLINPFGLKKGSRVLQGQPLAFADHTGGSIGNHLHVEVILPSWYVLSGAGKKSNYGKIDPQECIRPLPEAVEVVPASAELSIDAKHTFEAVGRDAAGNPVILDPHFLEWSLNGSCCELGQLHEPTTTVTARSAGSGTLIATYRNLSASAQITVLTPAAPVVDLKIVPESAELEVDETEVFTALGVNSEGETVPLDPTSVAWSLDGDCCQLGEQQKPTMTVTARRAGAATLIATYNNLRAEAQITVLPPAAPVSLKILPESAEIKVDEIREFTAVGLTARGDPVPLDSNSITWEVRSWWATLCCALLGPPHGPTATVTARIVLPGSLVAKYKDLPEAQAQITVPDVIFRGTSSVSVDNEVTGSCDVYTWTLNANPATTGYATGYAGPWGSNCPLGPWIDAGSVTVYQDQGAWRWSVKVNLFQGCNSTDAVVAATSISGSCLDPNPFGHVIRYKVSLGRIQ